MIYAIRCAALATVVGLGMTAIMLPAAEPPAAKATPAKEVKPAAKKGAKYQVMDYGPFLSSSFVTWHNSAFDNGPGSHTGDSTPRAITLKLSEDYRDALVFDADACRMSAGWLDGGLKMRGVIFDGGHGPNPSPAGPPLFQTNSGPGWANPADDSLVDPRRDNIAPLPRPGNLPKSWSHYKGLYRHGDQVVLSYSVGASNVLELGSVESAGNAKALVRTIRVDRSDKSLTLRVAAGKVEVPLTEPDPKDKTAPKKAKGGGVEVKVKEPAAAGGSNTTSTAHLGDELYAIAHHPVGAHFEITEGKDLILRLPASDKPMTLKVLISNKEKAPGDGLSEIVEKSPAPADLVAMTRGGPSRYPQAIEMAGTLSKDEKSAYVVDNIPIPDANPFNSWMRTAAFDFFTSDPTKAAVCTWSGDVWIVSGIDDKLDHVKWRRFATGLHQPLGLKIVNDEVYTVGHDQITRFHDLDKDGEADFYENFNSDWQLTTAFHAFCFDLHTDPSGNFLFMFGSPVHAGGGGFQKITDHHGTVLRVSPDGSKMDIYATGFRAPNGMGVGPNGEVTSGDNQGTYVSASPLHWIKEGSFNGVVDSAHGVPTHQPKALCFFPQSIDNSCGGQVWVPANENKWGPFAGDLLHMSYGKSSLFKVMKEEVNGQMQGGCVRFPIKFSSSAMRARFNKADGQLYVMGLRGWQSNAGKEGGFDRVRYTGKPVQMPTELHATTRGMKITFTNPLDAAAAADPANYSAEMWNYKWSGGYGSPEVSVYEGEKPADPSQPKAKKSGNHDPLTIKSVTLSPDNRTVFLEMPEIRPCWNMKITYNIKAADGSAMQSEIINTIHNLGKE